MPNKRTEQPWERQKGESAQAFEAFFLYLEMGADRSIRAVSHELGKSKTLIDRWSRTHNWVERCRAWDNHIQHEAKKAAITEVRNMTKRHVTMAQQIQNAAMLALKEMGSNMVNPKNFAAIVKLATDLERSSLVSEVDALSEDLKKAEEDSAAVKIICDIPRVQPAADTPPEEGGDSRAGS